RELFETGIHQAQELNVRILDAQVLGVEGFDTFTVKTTQGNFETQSLILATGSKRADPGIPGVKEFEGRGVSYCAICDAFFYRGKDVAVLGNGDFAMHEAKELSNTAASVTIYTDGKEPQFSPEPSIAVNTMKIQSVEGDEKVSGIRLACDMQAQDTESSSFCPADGVFIALGTAGSAEIARQMGAELTEKGNIKVNENMETTIPGLYAAGDCTGGLLQIAKAVYEGCQASIQAGKYVRSLNSK
ncbi:MAG: NAD(P)/FAD-dependent oxidoreductase, partial [Blautia sp.]|nr:NAD(P)/FAD-dependent oxidoreductase [Blautia sp.]